MKLVAWLAMPCCIALPCCSSGNGGHASDPDGGAGVAVDGGAEACAEYSPAGPAYCSATCGPLLALDVPDAGPVVQCAPCEVCGQTSGADGFHCCTPQPGSPGACEEVGFEGGSGCPACPSSCVKDTDCNSCPFKRAGGYACTNGVCQWFG